VETLRPLWKIWANSLDTDLDFYLHQLSQDSTALAPYVITVYSDGIARAMLVGQIRKQKASAVISFVNIPGPTMRVLEIKKGGRMGQDSQEIDRMLAMALFKATQSGAIDSIFFERLPLDCELFRQIRQIPASFLQSSEGTDASVFWKDAKRDAQENTHRGERVSGAGEPQVLLPAG
jgi:hypothetical protein